MVRLVARYALLVAAVVVLNFLLPRLLPGDPLADNPADGLGPALPALSAEARMCLRAYYHLDQPLVGQLAAYLADLGRGDLGWSISRSAPVSQLIAERLPWTLALVLTASILAAVVGVALGLLAAWRGGTLDRALLASAAVVAALPELLVALGLLLGLSAGLGWFPLQGGRSAFAPAPRDVVGWLRDVADVAWHLALPGLSLVLSSAAAFALVARGAVRGILGQPYLVTARAKGLAEREVALGHALPNALLPVVTLVGIRLGHVLGGAIVVERVFAVPGLGLLAVEALRTRDYPVLQAVFLLGSLGVLLAGGSLEALYRRLEPGRAPGGSAHAA